MCRGTRCGRSCGRTRPTSPTSATIDLTQADGHAERRAAMDMIHRHSPGSTRQLFPIPVAGYRIQKEGYGMRLFVGLDVSLAKTAICVISEHGKIMKEAQVASEPEELVRWIRGRG